MLHVRFQAIGTRGRQLQAGLIILGYTDRTSPLKVMSNPSTACLLMPVAANCCDWHDGFKRALRQTWIVHGEVEASTALAEMLRTDRRWTVDVARDGQTIDLDLYEVIQTNTQYQSMVADRNVRWPKWFCPWTACSHWPAKSESTIILHHELLCWPGLWFGRIRPLQSSA